MSIPATVLLRAIEYRIARPEPWAVVFTESIPVGGRPTRFMLYRRHNLLWSFQPVEGWGDVPCSHVVAAYQWVVNNIGDDFAATPLDLSEGGGV